MGYDSADDTWEDETAILSHVLIDDFERKRGHGGSGARAVVPPRGGAHTGHVAHEGHFAGLQQCRVVRCDTKVPQKRLRELMDGSHGGLAKADVGGDRCVGHVVCSAGVQ